MTGTPDPTAGRRDPDEYWCENWKQYRCCECHQPVTGSYACKGGDRCLARTDSAAPASTERSET